MEPIVRAGMHRSLRVAAVVAMLLSPTATAHAGDSAKSAAPSSSAPRAAEPSDPSPGKGATQGPTANGSAANHARFQGNWVYAGGDAERAALAAAIDRAVHTLVPIVKGIARGKLEQMTKIVPSCAFSFPASNIRSDVPGLTPMMSPEVGTVVRFNPGDGEVNLSQRFEGDRLIQRFVSSDGTRVNAFQVSADGRSFVMRAIVSSAKLSAPVQYSLTYSKVDPR